MSGAAHPGPDELVDRLLHEDRRRDCVTHVEALAARPARFAVWPTWLSQDLVTAFAAAGVERPWLHQVEAAERVRAGEHVVISTGTASGKSICYLAPALTSIIDKRGRLGQRGSTTLYLSPTKALAHDQAQRVAALGVPDLRCATHDGDSSPEERSWTRDHAEYVLTNPDMLHHSLLPDHARWHSFLAKLDHVVIDEMHHYRGVFGSHVAQVVRRLRRVCAAHGSSPTFVLASATVAEPEDAGERLTGLPMRAVSDDASPRAASTLVLWEPPLTALGGENGAPVRRAATAVAADLLTDLVVDEVTALAFVRSRRGAEIVADTTRRLLAEVDPSLVGRVAAYRGGYLPEERRDLEASFRSGRLRALAATTALELGIDISGLDAVIVAGFPGTRAGLWQQLGRAGRGEEPALGVLIARDDPLDTYLVHHPEALLGRPIETFVFDPDNPYVLGPHLCAAAAEVPLTEGDLAIFGPGAREAVDALTAAGLLRRRPQGWFWTDRRRPSQLADIRSSGGPAITLVESGSGRVLGTVDHSSAPGTVHAGAVYLHQGESWVVDGLDLEAATAMLTRDDVDHFTSARDVTDIEVLATRRERTLGRGRLRLGEVQVTHQVVSYLKRRIGDGAVIGEYPLDLPEQSLRTQAVWWTLPDAALGSLAADAIADLGGAAHAAEHASIGLLPLFATCDRWDIGGVSTRTHPDTGELTVFVYDGQPGGAGFSERGYERVEEWLRATRETVAGCECAEGCPSCVQSPKCGNQNHPLDKTGALALLDLLT